MKLHFVDTMDQVLAIALESPLPKVEETEVPTPTIAPPLTATTPESPTAHQ